MLLVGIVLVYCFGGVLSADTQYKPGHKYVTTKHGVIRGNIAEDGNYFAFLGIPYAAAPIGENRFKEPKPPLPWVGIYNATRTVMCPQIEEGEEDCLILNVFIPNKIIRKPLPVMFYIHGGSFIIGSGPSKGVEPLIKQDIIVVTINYRLGALGFLCLGTEDAPGNAGLKDQIAALTWVRDNIAYFGGDPNKVTIYGMSAGAASAEYILLSEMGTDLFRSAVIESASATTVWAIDTDPIKTAVNVAKNLNFTSNDMNTLTSQYKSVPVKTLTQANYKYAIDLIDSTGGFVPCVEKSLAGKEPFMTKPPREILATQNYDSVPVIFIFSSMEGLFTRSMEYYALNYKERMEANFADFLPADLIFDNISLKNTTAMAIKQFYFGSDLIDDDRIIDYLNYFGDFLILHGLFNSVKYHARNDNPVYLMQFAYKGQMGSYDKFYDSINLAGHGDAIKHDILIKPINNYADRIAVKRMSTMIANFVKHGNPTPSKTKLIPLIWPTIENAQSLTHVLFNKELTVQHGLDSSFSRRKLFWDDLYDKYGKKP